MGEISKGTAFAWRGRQRINWPA